MEDTSLKADAAAAAEALGGLLREHKGDRVAILDLRELNAWTDFFVIATAASSTHLLGLERHIKEFCGEQGLQILRRSRKPDAVNDEWCLIDLGPVVVHLMSEQARAFYDLERLWAPSRQPRPKGESAVP
jgi:ribosome-associated protein